MSVIIRLSAAGHAREGNENSKREDLKGNEGQERTEDLSQRDIGWCHRLEIEGGGTKGSHCRRRSNRTGGDSRSRTGCCCESSAVERGLAYILVEDGNGTTRR